MNNQIRALPNQIQGLLADLRPGKTSGQGVFPCG